MDPTETTIESGIAWIRLTDWNEGDKPHEICVLPRDGFKRKHGTKSEALREVERHLMSLLRGIRAELHPR